MPTRSRKSAELSEQTLTPQTVARDHADALFRASLECCRQHDRFARLLAKGHVESEEDAAQDLCHACDSTLDRMAQAYASAVANVRPEGREEWWRQANGLWIAAREYVRHHAGCDELTRRVARHDADRLGALHMEFELEASALLALRQACDGYARVRPGLS